MKNLLANTIAPPLSFGSFPHLVALLLFALIFTIVVECGIAMFFKPSKKLVLTMLFCNLVTNPLLNFIFLFITLFPIYGLVDPANWTVALILTIVILEILVVCVEAVVLRKAVKYPWKKSFQMSLLLNASSFLLAYPFITFMVW